MIGHPHIQLGILLALALAGLFLLEQGLSTFRSNKLTFKDGSFTVVSFSDMHFGERDGTCYALLIMLTAGNDNWVEWGERQDRNTQRVHGAILDRERPDYVVFNGDLVTGAVPSHRADYRRESVKGECNQVPGHGVPSYGPAGHPILEHLWQCTSHRMQS